MSGSILDTNVVTKLLDQDLAAISLVQKIDKLFTSVIVVGELYFAAANSTKREENFRKIREALSCVEIFR
jgi:predicted nucleic acid-binding protein